LWALWSEPSLSPFFSAQTTIYFKAIPFGNSLGTY
jgi:hypothetical protein